MDRAPGPHEAGVSQGGAIPDPGHGLGRGRGEARGGQVLAHHVQDGAGEHQEQDVGMHGG